MSAGPGWPNLEQDLADEAAARALFGDVTRDMYAFTGGGPVMLPLAAVDPDQGLGDRFVVCQCGGVLPRIMQAHHRSWHDGVAAVLGFADDD